MGSYQHYEFVAIDHLLEDSDLRELRKVSSRAEISRNRFMNVYHYGDFQGNETTFMKKWFDIHLYLSNWGRQLMIKLPKHAVENSKLIPCLERCGLNMEILEDETLSFEIIDDDKNIIIDIYLWIEESWIEDGEGWLPALMPLRSDLISGDLRLLYLVWLLCVEYELVSDDATEPIAGIGSLSPALETLVEFFEINQDLVQAAAEREPYPESNRDDFAKDVIDNMTDDEKSSLLLRLYEGDLQASAILRQRVRNATSTQFPDDPNEYRSADELRQRAQEIERERSDKTNKRRRR
ncbi:MAG: hypothetical protein OXE41_10575 [Gammaproteobacteria bacterium]|nr:hypothetical protein [Gammaproteobacteria bacterium]